MPKREDMKPWVAKAIADSGGKARIPLVAKHIWDHHKTEIESSGDLLYIWQYEMRWAADQLVKEKRLLKKRGVWELLK
jgi:hypothetical protein